MQKIAASSASNSMEIDSCNLWPQNVIIHALIIIIIIIIIIW